MKLIKLPISVDSNEQDKAPDSIIKEMRKGSLNESGKTPFFDIENIDNAEDITKRSKALMKDGCIFLGGSHIITFYTVKAFAESFPEPGLVFFDAHTDTGTGLVKETGLDIINSLIEGNIIKKENIILVGIRSWDKKDYDYLTKNRIKFFDMKKITELGIKEATELIMENARAFGSLYLSIDLDVVDPAFAVCGDDSVPGGLTSRELLYMIQKIKLMKNLKAADVMEATPSYDKNNIAVKLAAKIVAELF